MRDETAPMPLQPTRPDSSAEVAIIVNPTAGGMRGPGFRRGLHRLAAQGVRLRVLETSCRGDAERLAREAAETGMRAVVAAGGDGTINEAINGVMASGRAVPFGILPLGTANVLAGELGIDRIPSAADAIAAGRSRSIHLGECNGRYFAQMVGVGFDARVVAAVQPALKRRLGKGAYVVESLREMGGRFRPSAFRVAIDGGEEHEAASVIVANGHFYAGRFVLAPQATPDRPELHVCLFGQGRRIDAAGYALAMLLGRAHRLATLRVIPARTVEISAAQEDPVQADGDLTGVLPARIRVAERTLDVLAG